MIGIIYHKFGDKDTANLELQSAKYIFEQLKAKPDITYIDNLLQDKKTNQFRGLSQREIEVLRLIAKGKSNKTIANELFISERTVERHVSNIFTKLDLSSRSAATAYAFEHQLI